MAFLLIDDGMFEHEKIAALRDADVVAHMRAMCWSARRGTDGHIPPQAMRLLGITRAQAGRLVQAGVWETNGSAGSHVIHDWHDFNPPTDPVERGKWNARKRQQRRRDGLRDDERDTQRDESVTDA